MKEINNVSGIVGEADKPYLDMTPEKAAFHFLNQHGEADRQYYQCTIQLSWLIGLLKAQRSQAIQEERERCIEAIQQLWDKTLPPAPYMGDKQQAQASAFLAAIDALESLSLDGGISHEPK